MSAESTHYLELLERRLALLDSLAAALTAARTDIVSLDISGLEGRIAQQQTLCEQIHSLDASLERVQRQCAAHLGTAPVPSATADANTGSALRREILDRLNTAQANVKRLNREHQALLRRSRRTVSALLNSYHSFATTYANPSAARMSAGEGS